VGKGFEKLHERDGLTHSRPKLKVRMDRRGERGGDHQKTKVTSCNTLDSTTKKGWMIKIDISKAGKSGGDHLTVPGESVKNVRKNLEKREVSEKQL